MTNSNTTATEQARYVFPAGNDIKVSFKHQDDNEKVMVDVWKIDFKGDYFTANLILPQNAPAESDWLLGSIQRPDSTPVWSYKEDSKVRSGFFGRITLTQLEDITYAVYLTKGREPKVVFVVPITDLLQAQAPQRSLEQTLKRKRMVADSLGREVVFTKSERVFIDHQSRKYQEDREIEREQKRQQKIAERQRKIDAILARKKITVPSQGIHIEAIPVTGDEWKILPHILVVHGTTDQSGQFFPKEIFKVSRQPGKGAVKTARRPVTESVERLPSPVKTVVVMVDEEPYEVEVFASQDDLDCHRRAGLNSGALRGVEEADQFQLFRVTKQSLVPVQDFERLG
jgi:hypothetical protein